MSRRPVLTVQLEGVASLISGYRAAELIEQVTGRRPLWMPLSRAWSVQEHTARNVVALAERSNYDIVVTGGRQARRQRALDALQAAPAPRGWDPC